MPVTYERTRKARAERLLKQLSRGPSFLQADPFIPVHKELAAKLAYHYRLWVETWIIPEVEGLIPELRKKGDAR